MLIKLIQTHPPNYVPTNKQEPTIHEKFVSTNLNDSTAVGHFVFVEKCCCDKESADTNLEGKDMNREGAKTNNEDINNERTETNNKDINKEVRETNKEETDTILEGTDTNQEEMNKEEGKTDKKERNKEGTCPKHTNKGGEDKNKEETKNEKNNVVIFRKNFQKIIALRNQNKI